jgi:pimeloyl-ACP methyl ester carboxylesterase
MDRCTPWECTALKRALKVAIAAIALAAVGAGSFVLAARTGYLKPDRADLQQRYAIPASRFETVGGQPLHYAVEGKGPAVVLVHGSFASLRMWDSWAKALSKRYTVVRFDRPLMGLSGPSPSSRYDGDTDAAVILALADRLKLGRFALVGTSSSGEGVAHFAATHPDRVSAVILANIAAKPLTMGPTEFPFTFRMALKVDPWLGGWHPRLFWRGILEQNFADQRQVTPELVREWTDLNNLAQGERRLPRPADKPSFSGTPADLAAIRAPALVLWSDKDPEVPLETHGRDALATLGSADKTLTVVGNCGHMMPLECPGPSAAKALEFLDRVTGQKPPA